MAARKFLAPIDLAKNEIQNAVIQLLGSAPGSPVEGLIYTNSTTHKLEYYNGSAWIDPTARANHSGTQLASTISNFDTQVRTSSIDQMASTAGDVNLNSHKLTNVSNGTAAGDGVNFGQLQAVVNGRDFTDSVRARTTAALPANTYSNGASGVGATLTGNANGALAAQDGITLVANDRLLVMNEVTGANNGLYVLTQVGDGSTPYILTRATDANSSSTLTASKSVMVEEGTAYEDKQFTLTTNGAITVGTTALAFAQTGTGTTYTEGTGIDISGSAISIDTTVVVRKYATDVGDNSSTAITVTHSLGTRDVTVAVYDAASYAEVECDVVRTSTSVVTLNFAVAPTTNQYRAVVHG